MKLDSIASILIVIHASLGGIALVLGGIALIAKKGGRIHKKFGKGFYYAMLISAILAFIVAVMPGHKSPFLFSIGLFSSYFLINGYRSLRFKRKGVDFRLDKFIAYFIILTGLTMVWYPIVLNGAINIVLFVFGLAGLCFGIRDIRLLRNPQQLRKKWLAIHLGSMTGGYIAAVTAFFVVNQILPELLNWFAPTVVGSIYITFWIVKVRKAKAPKA